MGEAKRRGSYEERVTEGEAKAAERKRAQEEARRERESSEPKNSVSLADRRQLGMTMAILAATLGVTP